MSNPYGDQAVERKQKQMNKRKQTDDGHLTQINSFKFQNNPMN